MTNINVTEYHVDIIIYSYNAIGYIYFIYYLIPNVINKLFPLFILSLSDSCNRWENIAVPLDCYC